MNELYRKFRLHLKDNEGSVKDCGEDGYKLRKIQSAWQKENLTDDELIERIYNELSTSYPGKTIYVSDLFPMPDIDYGEDFSPRMGYFIKLKIVEKD